MAYLVINKQHNEHVTAILMKCLVVWKDHDLIRPSRRYNILKNTMSRKS